MARFKMVQYRYVSQTQEFYFLHLKFCIFSNSKSWKSIWCIILVALIRSFYFRVEIYRPALFIPCGSARRELIMSALRFHALNLVSKSVLVSITTRAPFTSLVLAPTSFRYTSNKEWM